MPLSVLLHILRSCRQWAAERTGLERWIPLAKRLARSLGVGLLKSKNAVDQKNIRESFFRFMQVRMSLNANLQQCAKGEVAEWERLVAYRFCCFLSWFTSIVVCCDLAPPPLALLTY